MANHGVQKVHNRSLEYTMYCTDICPDCWVGSIPISLHHPWHEESLYGNLRHVHGDFKTAILHIKKTHLKGWCAHNLGWLVSVREKTIQHVYLAKSWQSYTNTTKKIYIYIYTPYMNYMHIVVNIDRDVHFRFIKYTKDQSPPYWSHLARLVYKRSYFKRTSLHTQALKETPQILHGENCQHAWEDSNHPCIGNILPTKPQAILCH